MSIYGNKEAWLQTSLLPSPSLARDDSEAAVAGGSRCRVDDCEAPPARRPVFVFRPPGVAELARRWSIFATFLSSPIYPRAGVGGSTEGFARHCGSLFSPFLSGFPCSPGCLASPPGQGRGSSGSLSLARRVSPLSHQDPRLSVLPKVSLMLSLSPCCRCHGENSLTGSFMC